LAGKSRSGAAQKPQRRERSAGETLSARLRLLLGYLPLALKFGLVAAVLVFVLLGYRAAASARFFQVRSIEARGVSRSSAEAIQATVRSDVNKTGVWRANLQEISAHLEHLPWVRTAIVSRVLPDGIRVRISERQPRVVVHTSAGRLVWVDDDAVVLGEMAPTDQMPNFFLRGWNEDDSSTARAENRERVGKFLELQKEWDAQGLSERVSEVNLQEFRDVRAQLGGDDSQIEVRLGAQDLAERLKRALNTLDRLRQTPRGPFISYLDLNQGKRVIVGMVSGNRTVSESTESADSPGDPANVLLAKNSSPEPTGERSKKSAADKARDKNEKARNQAKKIEPKRALARKN
jgi:cell division septal protein FtsQ